MEWQPIETAPKEKKHMVLLYIKTKLDDFYFYDLIIGYRNKYNGKFVSHTKNPIRDGEPTHWMPLPPAPTETA